MALLFIMLHLGLRSTTPKFDALSAHDHWEIIQALRDHYHRFGAALPAFSHICHEHHLGKHCVDRLFHGEREAWRIAGMPDPGEEAKAYM